MSAPLLSRGGERLAALDRRPVPHRAILRALPYAVSRRFDPMAAGDLEAVFELRVRRSRRTRACPVLVDGRGRRLRVTAGSVAAPAPPRRSALTT